MKNKPFIFTSDKETADSLQREGFEFINQTGGGYLFYNDQSLKHNFDNKKITYTDKLFI